LDEEKISVCREGRREGGKEGRREGGKEGRRRRVHVMKQNLRLQEADLSTILSDILVLGTPDEARVSLI
jgi:hypothetical protein